MIMLGEMVNPGFGVLYLISQIFALICFVFDLLAVQQKRKTDLLKMDVIAASCSFLHYAFLGAWPGMTNRCVTTVRNAIAFYGAKHKRKSYRFLPIIFVIIYIILGIITYNSVFSLLPMAGAVVYTVAIYIGDVTKIRYAYVVANIFWLVYNIFVFSIVGIITQIAIVTIGLIAIFRYRKSKQTKAPTRR